MRQYDLILKNEKEKYYRRIGLILLFIDFISILFLAYEKGFSKWWPLIISLMAVFFVIATFYFKPKHERITFAASFFLFSLAWQTAGYWIPAALNLVFLILNGITSQKPLVSIDENQITYPSFPKKQIHWKELNNIILKDGLLSIDFKNNKLIQQLVDEAQIEIDEKEFNEFCRHQLNK